MLYEMLTGELPFAGEHIFDVIKAHIRAPIPRLPEGLSEWQGILDRTLAKDPADRFQTADELSQALERLVLPAL